MASPDKGVAIQCIQVFLDRRVGQSPPRDDGLDLSNSLVKFSFDKNNKEGMNECF
jgi:hypothetical protein